MFWFHRKSFTQMPFKFILYCISGIPMYKGFLIPMSFISESNPSPFDPPEHLFRLCLVCVLLDTCGQYLSPCILFQRAILVCLTPWRTCSVFAWCAFCWIRVVNTYPYVLSLCLLFQRAILVRLIPRSTCSVFAWCAFCWICVVNTYPYVLSLCLLFQRAILVRLIPRSTCSVFAWCAFCWICMVNTYPYVLSLCLLFQRAILVRLIPRSTCSVFAWCAFCWTRVVNILIVAAARRSWIISSSITWWDFNSFITTVLVLASWFAIQILNPQGSTFPGA